jgi:hypothetical protein
MILRRLTNVLIVPTGTLRPSAWENALDVRLFRNTVAVALTALAIICNLPANAENPDISSRRAA